MRRKLLAMVAAGLLAGLMTAQSAHAYSVTISGQGIYDGNWDVTTLGPDTFNNNLALLTSQAWYNNSALATAFAGALAGGLGYPNGSSQQPVGPLFAYFADPFFVSTVLFCGASSGLVIGPCNGSNSFSTNTWGYGRDESRVWAVATPVVPLPGGVWLLASALGALGWVANRLRPSSR